MTKKERWLQNSIKEIKAKNLQVPFMLNTCTTVTDLDKLLRVLEASIRKTEKAKILKTLTNQIEELVNYEEKR